MKTILPILVILTCTFTASMPAVSAELQGATSAEISAADGQQVETHVDAVLLVGLEQMPILSRDDVIVDWRRAGGIQPTPFRIAMPAGCFVARMDRFGINGNSCGVAITLDGRRLMVDSFVARLVPPDRLLPGDPYRLRIRAELVLSAPDAAELLSTLGGATVLAQIGAERGTAQANAIRSKSGTTPDDS